MTQIRLLCLTLAVAVGTPLAQAARAAQTCADPSLKLTPRVPAMVTVTLAAPCHAGESVTITHAGLRFPARTDDKGGLTLTLPALSSGPHKIEVQALDQAGNKTTQTVSVSVP